MIFPNPAYIRAFAEMAMNEGFYNGHPENLPTILKEFIVIGEKEGYEIEIGYGVQEREENAEHNTYAGFYITNNTTGKRIFIEDYLVEKSIEGNKEYQEGIEWFKESLEQQKEIR